MMSSIGSLIALWPLILRDCKNLRCLPDTICSLNNFHCLNLSRCSKIVYLPKDLGKMESLSSLHLNELVQDFLHNLCLGGLSVISVAIFVMYVLGCISATAYSVFCRTEQVQDFLHYLCLQGGQSGKLLARRLPSIFPGSEIPSWLKEVKICAEPYSSSVTYLRFLRYPSHYANVNRIFETKKVNIQAFNGCDEWKGILLCLVFVPLDRHRHPSEIDVYSVGVDGRTEYLIPFYRIGERYCKFESHHLKLVYLPLSLYRNANMMSPPCSCGSIDAKGFHQVEIKIATGGLVYEGEFLRASSNRSEVKRIR
ncbi:hypothetical protein SO802_007693 [Lithocarpus litseifolius]|uniref:Uncharacterized protein n=1 Tax=Lithocarpus litseifolius TaxID=425828 RepID=A0AAW2DPD2_9ROSI